MAPPNARNAHSNASHWDFRYTIYHGTSATAADPVYLRCAVRDHHPGFPDGGLGAGDAQTGGFEIGPGLLRTVAASRANVESIRLGEGLRYAGRDLRGESGKNGKGCGGKGGNRDSAKSFDHHGPLLIGPFRPVGS
jgi:hypothetical protein